MASVHQSHPSHPSPGVALPTYSDDEGSTTPKPRASSKPKCSNSTKRGSGVRQKPAALVTTAAGTIEGQGSQASTSGSHGQSLKHELLEPNYELIHSLASALSKHLMRKNLTAEKSRDFMVKCVKEIIHICDVCIKKEAKRKEAEGRVKTVSARLEGTTALDNGSNSIPGINTNTCNVKEEPVVVAPGDAPLIGPQIYTSKRGNICNEHHPQFVGSPFPKSVPVTPKSEGTGLLSQWFGSDKLNYSAKILPNKPELPPQEPFGLVQKMNTALQCFWIPETEAYLIPATSSGTEIPCITHQQSPHRAPAAEESPCIRSWQWKMPLSNFDLYRPITMTYPDDDYLFEDSPVFYHESSLKHRTATAVWKNLSFINSQEVFRWERIFCETLTMTLEILKKQTTKFQEIVTTHRGNSERVAQTDNGALWTDHEWPVSYFIEEMKNRYTKQFGLPRYLITDEGLMRFLRTRETIRSMSSNKYQVTDEQRLLGKNNEVTYQASLGFTSKPMIQDVRRFTPLICNCSPYEWYKATVGEEFVFKPTLWDPHHPYMEIETTTTYTLEPKLPWLTWSHTRKAFVGVPPRKMISPFKVEEDVMMSRYVENTEDEDLDLTVVAFSFLTLPQGVQFERTIKASTTIHIQPSRQAIQVEAPRYRDTSNVALMSSERQGISPGIDQPGARDSKKTAARELGTQSDLWGRDDQVLHNNVELQAEPKAESLCYFSKNGDELEHTIGLSVCGSGGENTTSNKLQVHDTVPKCTTSTTNPTLKTDAGCKCDVHMVNEPTDNFAIVGDIHSTWGVVENTALVPSAKYPLWARQRAYIEHCVTVRGKKMIGMFGRREKYDSDSSETELSDDESRYLKHIPFVKNYRQESQPVWKATADEDEPLFKPTCTASGVTVIRSAHVPGVNSRNPHNNDQDRIDDGVSAAINEVIEKTIRMTRELGHSPATIDVLPTGLPRVPAYTIAPTPIRVQPNLASALEASTGDDGFSHSNKSTNGINARWPNDHGERSFLLTELDESDSDTEGIDQNVERYGVGSDEGKVTSIDTRCYPGHGVSVIESLEYEPWSPID